MSDGLTDLQRAGIRSLAENPDHSVSCFHKAILEDSSVIVNYFFLAMAYLLSGEREKVIKDNG